MIAPNSTALMDTVRGSSAFPQTHASDAGEPQARYTWMKGNATPMANPTTSAITALARRLIYQRSAAWSSLERASTQRAPCGVSSRFQKGARVLR